MTMIWIALHPAVTLDHLGYLPGFLSETDPRSAAEQFNTNYVYGGWRPFKGHRLNADNSLAYPGDPPMYPIAETQLRDELILLYPSDWVAIIQPNRSFEVCRM